MWITLGCLLLLGASVSGKEREKRQASYTFPGPRSEAANRQAAAAVYRAQQEQRATRAYLVDEHEDPHLYPATRRQYQEQPVQYGPSQGRGQPAPQPAPEAPVYEAPRPAPRQSYSSAPRKKASASSRANKYGGSAAQQALNGGSDDEDVEQGPDPLTLLLEDSKFTCGGKTDGYYADDSVSCQVFHYCVSGARHSWMCPEGTVFHQVHLNCVPDSQDICAQSQKFHFVNDYLYKPVDYQGPNNTARYAQRYYPDGYVVGDPLVSPHDNQAAARPAPPPSYRAPQVQSYPAQPPAQRPAPRPVAPPPPPPPPPQQSHREPSHSPRYGHAQALAAARGVRPSRPAYEGEIPQGYRGAPRQEPQPQPVPVQDEIYQPQPEARRPISSARSNAGYAPPRQQQQHAAQPPPQQQQYRPASARSTGGRPQYAGYASNQAAGVQYDEDY